MDDNFEMSCKIELALELACRIHRGQTDKAGKPYILHPLAVWHRVRFEDEETQIAALLHDALEDVAKEAPPEEREIARRVLCETIQKVFGDDVYATVLALTRLDDEVYFQYVKRAGANPRAKKIKKADLQENMSPERIAALSEKERGIVDRYRRAFSYLEKN